MPMLWAAQATSLCPEILWQVLSKDSKYSSNEDARTTAEPLTWEDANESKYFAPRFTVHVFL